MKDYKSYLGKLVEADKLEKSPVFSWGVSANVGKIKGIWILFMY